MSRFNWAPTAYRMLNGVFCVYKPESVSSKRIISSVKLNLTKDLNALPCYQHEIPLKQTTVLENADATEVSDKAEPDSIQDWSEHRLVLGDRYEETDFKVNYVDGLSTHSSGVQVMGIGPFGRESIDMIAMSKFLRVYHVKGRLGWATDDFSPRGHIIERTSYKHVSRDKLERICAAAQAAHTRQMYSLHGVNPDSQEAYEMAASGIIRPVHRRTEPILYGVKCIDFQSPNFTLEIHSINETCMFLRKLVHDLAIRLKTTAVCSGIRRLRYGNFDPRRALLRQHWHLDFIVDNIESNMDLLDPDRLFVGTQMQRTTLLPPRPSARQLSEGQHLIDHGLSRSENIASEADQSPDPWVDNSSEKLQPIGHDVSISRDKASEIDQPPSHSVHSLSEDQSLNNQDISQSISHAPESHIVNSQTCSETEQVREVTGNHSEVCDNDGSQRDKQKYVRKDTGLR